MPTTGVDCRGIFGPRGFGAHSGAVCQIRKEGDAANTIGHYMVDDEHERDGAAQRFRRRTRHHGRRPKGPRSKKRGIHRACCYFEHGLLIVRKGTLDNRHLLGEEKVEIIDPDRSATSKRHFD